MRQKVSKLLSLMLALVLVWGIMPMSALAKTEEEGRNTDVKVKQEESHTQEVEYYGRNALSQLPNAKALLYAYDKIVAGVEASEKNISVYNGTNAISMEEIQVVYDAYTRDHAEHFWLGNSYSMGANASTVTIISPSYSMSGAALTAARNAFDKVVSDILSGITDTMSEAEKELYLHDRLAAVITYAGSTNAHNAYGALVEGKGVCDGYAKALQCLLHCVGIQSFIAQGTSLDPGTGISENHAWNYVRINGAYYHTDLTWDDQETRLFYAYFNQTDAAIREDHVIFDTQYALPACSSEAANYFTGSESKLTSYTVDSIASLLKNNGFNVHVYIPAPKDVDAFAAWFGANIMSIAAKAGVTGRFSYGYARLGRELILKIETCAHTALTLVPETAASCEEPGNQVYYKCTCGKLFKKDRITETKAEYETIAALGHAYGAWYRIKSAAGGKAQERRDCNRCDAYQLRDLGYVGWHKDGSVWYYYQDGSTVKGWQKIDNVWYYFAADGIMQTGWQKVNGQWYYMDGNGAMVTGWVKDAGKWYYMDGNGAMATGWVKDAGKWYYMDGNGAMATGWVKDAGKWYYMDGNGVMATGWVKDAGKWYYMDGNGVMATGWVKDAGKWYYLNSDMKTGWQKINGNWYYLDSDMKTGWLRQGNIWYYLLDSGIMATGTHLINGVSYTFGSGGAWITD